MSDYLDQEQQTLDQFIALLRSEQDALINADVQTLLTLSESKLKLGDQLNQMASERIAMLREAGFSADAAGVRGWLSGQPKAIVDRWETLMECARMAQRMNQTNGKLIATHLQHNQQALAALMNASNQSSVYGPDGQARLGANPSPRTIGKV